MGFPFCGGVNAPGNPACRVFEGEKMSGQFRFERLPFMSSAEDHQDGPGAFEQPRFLSRREHS